MPNDNHIPQLAAIRMKYADDAPVTSEPEMVEPGAGAPAEWACEQRTERRITRPRTSPGASRYRGGASVVHPARLARQPVFVNEESHILWSSVEPF
jgi:hypothetical protein